MFVYVYVYGVLDLLMSAITCCNFEIALRWTNPVDQYALLPVVVVVF